MSRGYENIRAPFFISHFPFVHFSCLLCLFCLKKRLSRDQWGFGINFRPRSCNRFWTRWILVKRNLKTSKTSKQLSLTFNEYQPAGRRRGVPDSHIIGTGMLVGKLELKRLRRLYFNKVWWCLAFLFRYFFTHSPKRIYTSWPNWHLYLKKYWLSRPGYPRWDRNSQFLTLSETTSFPVTFIWGVPLGDASKEMSPWFVTQLRSA